MKFMKLGSKPDAFQSDGAASSCRVLLSLLGLLPCARTMHRYCSLDIGGVGWRQKKSSFFFSSPHLVRSIPS
ncbi:BTB/POZ domain-containing protein NPY1 [Zea mays]|uniref:BTB/POZ domain-containing protein NPY1 n=1 Tax=Zea mays TaxID=4577 RepID=A0A1D6I4H4_MAIZE|nr:BTB/POZ domain-containing protein NPY1 [Zea mays]